MNIVDEFFAARTWRKAIPLLLSRRSELLEEPAKIAFKRRVGEFGGEKASCFLLQIYLDLMHSIIHKNEAAFDAIQEGNFPKLTDVGFRKLAKITDIASARTFSARSPRLARWLIVSRAIQGDSFWLLLLASATKTRSAPITQVPSFAKTTIVAGERGDLRRFYKIFPLSDGGFAIAAPYHKARSGFLLKWPRTREIGFSEFYLKDAVPFHASDRVKLSYHREGFVQFSGESSSKITSGWDAETGKAKGLGLMCRPLRSPSQSGPSVACGVWGIADFDPWTSKPSEHAIIFQTDDDYYIEPEPPSTSGRATFDGYEFSVFVFQSSLLEAAIGVFGTGDEISLVLPMNIFHPDRPFRVKLVRISQDFALGVIGKRAKFSFPESGFQLSGPGDGKDLLTAIYPELSVADKGRNLDR